MPFDPHAELPYFTADLPGIGGKIKQQVEDFEVEEIPAYEPSGEGEFLFLWVEKRGMGGEYFLRQLARRLDIPTGEIGSAGIKDRHAVTRQMVSVPARVKDRVGQVDGDGIQVLRTGLHGNKLRAGHLHGNRFRILLRDVDPRAGELLPPIIERLQREGMPNWYGPQRFGRAGETMKLGLSLLGARGSEPCRPPRSPFLRKLALSAGQSALFNHYLTLRLGDGFLRRVLPGDVMSKWPFGGMFVAEDVDREQARFDARETVSSGPIFGRKMFKAAGAAAEREAAVLADAGLSLASFAGFGKLLQGTRRHNLVYFSDLAAAQEPDGVRLSFTLPAGTYATILIREITKISHIDTDETDGNSSGSDPV